MEAMAMSLACIEPWIAGIPELIRDGVDGMPGAIGRLYGDRELCLTIGSSARRRVLELYNLERNIGALAETFHRRISRRITLE